MITLTVDHCLRASDATASFSRSSALYMATNNFIILITVTVIFTINTLNIVLGLFCEFICVVIYLYLYIPVHQGLNGC